MIIRGRIVGPELKKSLSEVSNYGEGVMGVYIRRGIYSTLPTLASDTINPKDFLVDCSDSITIEGCLVWKRPRDEGVTTGQRWEEHGRIM